jgi:hypothetical protein
VTVRLTLAPGRTAESRAAIGGFLIHTTFEKGICDMFRAPWNGAVIVESDDTVVIGNQSLARATTGRGAT